MDISNLKPDFGLENTLWNEGYRVVGIDEAGRGTWAGPLFVGAVWLKPQHVIPLQDYTKQYAVTELRDSKGLTSRQRVEIYRTLVEWGIEFSVGDSPPMEIDALGIEKAFEVAVSRAFNGLLAHGLAEMPFTLEMPVAVLIDGRRYKNLEVAPGIEIFAEDRLDAACVSVALASIVAKTHQEAQMRGLDFIYPEYGLAKHNGYVTKAHREAVEKYGLSPVHRKSWANPDK